MNIKTLSGAMTMLLGFFCLSVGNAFQSFTLLAMSLAFFTGALYFFAAGLIEEINDE